jgi:hypothetical protein
MDTEFWLGKTEERKPLAKVMKKCSYVTMDETDSRNM